jgi:AcrR family transcriptional regulator
MGRPKSPLIERGAALDAALAIIDKSGVEGFSIRRLADELGVNGASLYHHFKNKDAILVEATERAIKRTPMVILDVPHQDWRSLLLSGSTQLLDLLLSHPTLMPIIIKRRAMGMANRTLDAVTARLIDAGVPEGAVYPMFEALERFVVGWATREIAGGAVDGAPDGEPTPHLNSAVSATAFTDRQLFDVAVIGIMNSIVQAVQSQGAGPSPAKRPPAKRPPAKRTRAAKRPERT